MLGPNSTFLESGHDFVPDGLNVNIGTGGAAFTGIWVHLQNYLRAYCLIIDPAGSDADDLVLTPLQATSGAGAGSKALAFSRFWVKQGASVKTVGTWTQYDLTTPSSALNLNSVVGNQTTLSGTAPVAITATDLALETVQSILVVEFTYDMLDISNGFGWLSMTIPQLLVTGTRTINSHWILANNEFPQQLPLSPLV